MRVVVDTKSGLVEGDTRGPSHNGMTYVVLDGGCAATFPDERVYPLEAREDKDLRPENLERK